MAGKPGSDAGMTLIEVMVVIAIMAVLAAIVVPVFAAMQSRHHFSSCASNLKAIGQALLMYRADHMGFPPDPTEWWVRPDPPGEPGLKGLGLAHLYYAYWANATAVTRPDGDEETQWHATGSPHFAQVNDPVTLQEGEPEPGDTGAGIWADNATHGAVAAFTLDLEPIAEAQALTQVDLWVYCRREGGGAAEASVNLAGWRPGASLNPGGEWTWRRHTWGGRWTQEDADDLQVRFTARTPHPDDLVEVATVLVEVTYSHGAAVVSPGNYLTRVRVLHCPRAPVGEADFGDWPYLGGYNTYDWNYRRDRSDVWPEQGVLRNLLGPFPPDNTVVTWCPMHRQMPPGDAASLGDIQGADRDLVLWADGSVRRMPARYDQYQAEQPR